MGFTIENSSAKIALNDNWLPHEARGKLFFLSLISLTIKFGII
jgi:hypothetical protein